MYQPNNKGDNNPFNVIDLFCGAGGFIAKAYISSFIVGLRLLWAAHHARELQKQKQRQTNKALFLSKFFNG